MSKRVSLSVSCPHCFEKLKDESVAIGHRPAIHLKIRMPDGHFSQIWLSSIYGDFTYISEIPIPEQTIVEFFCPHCDQQLTLKNNICDVCDAPVISFICSAGGKVSICSRCNCRAHHFVFDDIETALTSHCQDI